MIQTIRARMPGGVSHSMSNDELVRIAAAASKIAVQGVRYSNRPQRMLLR